MSIEFAGGTLIRVKDLENRPDAGAIGAVIQNVVGAEVNVRPTGQTAGGYGFEIEVLVEALDNEREGKVKGVLLDHFGVEEDARAEWLAAHYTKPESMGSILTSIYRGQAWQAIICAFIAMAIIILVIFMRKITVGAILLTVGLNLLGIFGCMAIFGVPLSPASVIGVLLIIGYSVDTNILLSTRALKRVGGEVRERVADAMRTGMVMCCTTLLVLITINIFMTAPALDQLSAVLIFGIVADIFNTWFMNAGLLLRHVERQQRREYHVSL